MMMHTKIILDILVSFWYNSFMAKTQISTRISPEGLEIANAYLQLGSIPAVCARLSIDEAKASEYLAKREVKQYVDQVYLDTGYRNRFKLADTLDTLIDKKIEEAKQIKDRDIAEALQLPPIKLHCSVLAEDSIKKAIENWEEKSEHRKHNQYDSSSDEVGQD